MFYLHSISKREITYIQNNNLINIFLDDSLYSHYYYIHELNKPILAITTSYIDLNNKQLRKTFKDTNKHLSFITCDEYVTNYLKDNDKKYFMNLEELKYIYYNNLGIIAGHSHFHDVTIIGIAINKNTSKHQKWLKYRYNIETNKRITYKIGSRLAHVGYKLEDNNLIKRTEKEYIDFIKYDTELMLEFFQKHLNYQPKIYVFPFNQSSDLLIEILKTYGFEKFYGNDRKELKI